MIIQTILLDPSGAVWTDEESNLSRPDPTGAIQVDAEHPARNRRPRVPIADGPSWFGVAVDSAACVRGCSRHNKEIAA